MNLKDTRCCECTKTPDVVVVQKHQTLWLKDEVENDTNALNSIAFVWNDLAIFFQFL